MAVNDKYRNRGGNREVCQAIKKHFDILEYIKQCRPDIHFKERNNGVFECTEHSLYVTPSKGIFYWHSKQAGGSIIDFVMFHNKVSEREAISQLRLEMGGQPPQRSPEKYNNFAEKKRDLVLPPAVNGKYSRVFAYLTKTRCIDGAVVADAVHRKMLYEDAEHHNCVFVGFGEDGKPSYAAERGTTPTQYRKDIPGSKKTGWFIDNKSRELFVTEAPIDALSVMTLMKLGGKDYTKYSYLAQGGSAAIKTLEKCIASNPNISRIYLCYDNDEGGRNAASAAQKMLKAAGYKGSVVDKIPIQNDFNDDLKHHVAQTNRAMNTTKTILQGEQLCLTR